jgi:hypothetical protein
MEGLVMRGVLVAILEAQIPLEERMVMALMEVVAQDLLE